MKFLHKSIAAVVLLVIICFSGCGFGEEYKSEFFAMNTVMMVTAYGSESENAVKVCKDEIYRLDALLSVENNKSEVCKLNSKKTAYVSDDLLELVSYSKEMHSLTDGAFDITTQPLVRLWGFYSGLEKHVPSQSEIDSALKLVGSDYIKTDESTVTLSNEASIDLGGIAKGYASKRAAEILNENNVSSALISLGGNVRAVGAKPDGSPWSIGITNPDDNSVNAAVLKVSDCAVVTSGAYQRYFEQDGKIYHHIIDPKTGYPAQSGLKSVTIVSRDDCLADALSTAMFVNGLEKSKKICLENSNDFGAVFITDQNKIYITENLEDCFYTDYDFEVIKS